MVRESSLDLFLGQAVISGRLFHRPLAGALAVCDHDPDRRARACDDRLVALVWVSRAYIGNMLLDEAVVCC